MKGRKPSTARLRLLNSDTERVVGGVTPPVCPEWLEGDARVEWDRIVIPLTANYLITTVDAATLAAYCQTYANWKAAEAQVAKDGTLCVSSRGDLKLHPMARYSLALLSEIRRLAAEFGFSPAARSRIDIPRGESEEDMDFDSGGSNEAEA